MNSTTIKTDCPACDREANLHPDDVLLVLRERDRGRYEFTCPLCLSPCSKQADRRHIRLLRTAGVRERHDMPPSNAEIEAWARALNGTHDVVGLMEWEVSRG